MKQVIQDVRTLRNAVDSGTVPTMTWGEIFELWKRWHTLGLSEEQMETFMQSLVFIFELLNIMETVGVALGSRIDQWTIEEFLLRNVPDWQFSDEDTEE